MITIAHDHLGNRVHVDDTKSAFEYFCPVCGSPLDTKKGEILRHHFAHKPHHKCSDSWHGAYCDTEWHFAWQERYPCENRELVLQLGETKHRADVIIGKTVVEFQHSALAPKQFNDRNSFYADLGYKVIWLYDLRDLYGSGVISETHDGSGQFTWDNPRKSFNAYDLRTGSADLFFQLRDDDGSPCIVQVGGRSEAGFEEFSASRWMTSDEFLQFTGSREDACPAPCLTPLEPNEDYLRFKERYSIELNPQQERAVQAVDGATLLLAVPGSGKTTVMVARIGYLVVERHVPPERVVAITFTKSAAEEMRTRLARQFKDGELARKVKFCTINSLCYEIYKKWASGHPRRKTRSVIDASDQRRLLRETIHRHTKKFVSQADITELETAISLAKNRMLDGNGRLMLDGSMPHFSEMYDEYCHALKDRGLMDFDDQLAFAKYVLENDETILREYRSSYQYWCVDEAQDTSALQHRIIEMLARDSRSVFMVGDEDQSIYGYRGACPEELLNFRFTYSNAFVLMMERNYRSGDEIVSAANTFVGRCKGRYEKHMVSERGKGSAVRAIEVPDRMAQYDAVLETIRSHTGPGTLAVIYRDNETAVPLVDRLLRKGVPYQMLSKSSTFFTSAVVREIKAFLSLTLDPYDREAFKAIWAKTDCGIRKTDVKHVLRNTRRGTRTVAEALHDQISTYRKNDWERRKGARNASDFAKLIDVAELPPLEAIDHIMSWGYGNWLRRKNIPTHRVDLLRQIASRETSIPSFIDRLGELDEVFKSNKHCEPSSIVLSTAHSCKGREFEQVLILDAVCGSFPSEQENPFRLSKDAAIGYQEERRLFYVAMTRAKDELILMRPLNMPTPFVDEVVPRDSGRHGDSLPNTPAPATGLPISHREAHIVKPTITSQPKPASPAIKEPQPVLRYDIKTWKTKRVDFGNKRLVTNGDMDAMISVTYNGRCADMNVDFVPAMLQEMADHFEDMTKDYVESTLCLDAHNAQDEGQISIEELGNELAIVRVSEAASANTLPPINALLDSGAELSMTYRGSNGLAVGRCIESVDEEQHTIRLSEILTVY